MAMVRLEILLKYQITNQVIPMCLSCIVSAITQGLNSL